MKARLAVRPAIVSAGIAMGYREPPGGWYGWNWGPWGGGRGHLGGEPDQLDPVTSAKAQCQVILRGMPLRKSRLPSSTPLWRRMP